MSDNIDNPPLDLSNTSTRISIEEENSEYQEISELFKDMDDYEIPDSRKHKNVTHPKTLLVEPKWFTDYRAGKRENDAVGNIPEGFRIARKYEMTTIAYSNNRDDLILPLDSGNTMKDLEEINVESKERLVSIKLIEEKTSHPDTNGSSTNKQEETVDKVVKTPEQKRTSRRNKIQRNKLHDTFISVLRAVAICLSFGSFFIAMYFVTVACKEI